LTIAKVNLTQHGDDHFVQEFRDGFKDLKQLMFLALRFELSVGGLGGWEAVNKARLPNR
jgi:hypothetical protein